MQRLLDMKLLDKSERSSNLSKGISACRNDLNHEETNINKDYYTMPLMAVTDFSG